jgi:drug/metabolite transporter (DMT)-like permease
VNRFAAKGAHLTGIGLALLSAVLFGAVTVSAKSLLESAGPGTVGALTYLGAGLVGAFAAPAGCVRELRAPGAREDLPAFAAALVLGAVAAPLLLMTGLQWTSASLASVLANIEGIATAGFAWFLFREKSNLAGMAGVTAILAGVICFTGAEDIGASGGIGPLLISMAYLCWALDLNLMRRVRHIAPATAIAVRGAAGALVMAAVAWVGREALPAGMVAAGALLTGAVGFGISFMMMLKALPLIGSAKAGAIFAAAPIFGYLCSCAAEGGGCELSTARLVAMTLIVLGISMAGAEAFACMRRKQRTAFGTAK